MPAPRYSCKSESRPDVSGTIGHVRTNGRSVPSCTDFASVQIGIWEDFAETGVVRFENVGLRYGLGTEILRDVTFRIEPHSFQFLTGPSGAGKTSLLRLLFLSLKPTRGLITLFGHNIAVLGKDSLATLRRRIGVVFQDFRLLDHLTTYENVALPFKVLGRTEESFRDEVVELLRWVGLGERMGALPPVLS